MTSLQSPQRHSPYQSSILACASPGTPRRSIHTSITTPHAHVSSSQDDLSSSDKENSPADAYISRNISNMSSETLNNPLSFTPRRQKALPRAWERRPATPYVPRNDGQKIWKRIPLGELASGHSNIQESRQKNESQEDYVRAVKKLKVDEAASGVAVDTGAAFVGTKWEEENIEKGGSPKKKVQIHNRQISGDQTIASQTRLDEEKREQEHESGRDLRVLSGDINAVSTASTPGITNRSALEHDSIGAPSVDDDKGLQDSDSTAQSDNNASVGLGLQARSEIGMVELTNHGLPPTPECDLGGLPKTEKASAKASASGANQEIDVLDTDQGYTDSAPQNIFVTSIENLAPGNDEKVLNKINTDGVSLEIKPTTDVILPPTERSAENAIERSDDLPISPIPEKSAINGGIVSEGSPAPETSLTPSSESDNMPVSTRSMKAFVGTDSDETAFLHDFLLRARASKVARSTTGSSDLDINTNQDTNKASVDHAEEQDALASDDIEDSETSSSGTYQSEAREVAIKGIVSSPIRRSARTATGANTKLPRPQTLSLVPQFGPVLPSQNLPIPNTIQLKRATGTEFIFNAKVQQTLAMATRANTKRNQGTSVNVMTRLAQIKSATATSDEGIQSDGDSSSKSLPAVISADVPSPVKSNASKKRKRGKNDQVLKARKTVKWNEELASYQEPVPISPESKPSCSDFAEIEAAAQAEALMPLTNSVTFSKPVSSDLVETTTEVDPAKKPSEPVSGSNTDGNSQSDSSKHEVRKLRKISIGSVNGTPAPKTRSQSSRLTPVSLSSTLPSSIPKLGSRMLTPASKNLATSKQQPGSTTVQQNKAPEKEQDKSLVGRRSLRARS